jgi:NAD(P)H-flavin reductase
MAFLGAVIVLAMLRTAVVKLMYPHSQIRSLITKRPNTLTRLVQRHIIYPSTYSHIHAVRPQVLGVSFSIPTRAQNLVIFTYLALTLGLICSELTNISFPENVYWTKENYAWTRYLADRAGTMAVSQLPFIFLFGGRNNILIPLTGWDYSTFNVYHKLASRTMVALALVHTFAYIVSSLIRGGYDDLAHHAAKNYYIWGFVAMGVSSIMIVQSVYDLRKLAYDFFSVLHIILAALFLAAMKWHLDPHGWMEWVWASVAIWAFDRFIRLVRLVYFNLGLSSTATAQVELLTHDNLALLKFKVRLVRSVAFQPGKYVFLHIGGVAPWSAHPVSVIDQDEDGCYNMAMTVHQGLTRKLYHRLMKDSTTDKLAMEVSKTATLRVGIDGFYGHTAPVDLYDSVLLIAGGIGITAVIGYVKALAMNRKSWTKHVMLVWVVRDFVYLDWFREQLGQLVDLDAEHVSISIQLYATGGGEAKRELIEVGYGQSFSSSSSSTASGRLVEGKKGPAVAVTPTSPATDNTNDNNNNEKPTLSTQPSLTSLPISHTRPDMSAVISEFVHSAPASVAVLACGPAGMVDDIRAAVCCNVDSAKARLDYFEEAFGW